MEEVELEGKVVIVVVVVGNFSVTAQPLVSWFRYISYLETMCYGCLLYLTARLAFPFSGLEIRGIKVSNIVLNI